MRRFIIYTFLLAMFVLASSGVYAQGTAPIFDKGDGTESIRAGYGNNASGTYSIAFGWKNVASGTSSSAFGHQNTASEQNSSAFGYGNNASGQGSSAFGWTNGASGQTSSAFGWRNTASEQNSSAFGHLNTAFGTNSSAFGSINKASGAYSSAFGYRNNASGTNSSAFGNQNNASGTNSSAFGYGNEAIGANSSAIGFKNEANVASSSAFGYMNKAIGADSSAIGSQNKANGEKSSAIGYRNISFCEDSSVFGNQSIASAACSTAIGYQAVAKEANTVSFGHSAGDLDIYNTAFSDDLNSRLVHVATGTDLTDAVNVGQLKDYAQAKLSDAQLDAANSGITSAKVTTYDTYISSDGLTAGDKKITNVLAGTVDTDAVNVGQLKDYAQAKLSDAQLAAANSGITSAKVIAYDEKITAYDAYISSEGLTGGSKKIANVLAGTDDTDAVNYGQFKLAYVDASFDSENSELTLKTASGNSKTVKLPSGSGSGTDPEVKKTIEQHTNDIKKLLTNLGFSAEKENKPSEGSIAIGDSNEAGTTENISMAIGSGNKVTGKDSIAIGYSSSGLGNTVSGNNSIAVGFGHQISGNNSGAFGDPSYIDTDNSYAVGNNNHITGDSSFALGNNVNISAQNGVALGNNTEVSAKNAVAIGEGSKATEEDTVSVGSDSKKRRITNVDKAKDGTDAVNYDQMKDYISENVGDAGEIIKLRQDVAKIDSRVSKVGASAAALAALKPMEFDPEKKWSAGVGFGNLNGKSAAAVGIFYRPNRDVYYSLGGNVGGEENIVNAGISFSFGHRGARPVAKQIAAVETPANEAFCQENADLRDKVAAQNTEICSLKNQNAVLENKAVVLENKNGELETRIKRLERLIVKMSKED